MIPKGLLKKQPRPLSFPLKCFSQGGMQRQEAKGFMATACVPWNACG